MTPTKRTLVAAVLATAAASAAAHTGHGTHGLAEGLMHPLGVDHLLAMVAVGIWSAAAMPFGRRWQAPAVFLLLLTGGALAGVLGFALPLVESAIALSVAVLGAMLLAPRAVPPSYGLMAIGLAAALHGLAHGAELPSGASFSGFAAGFLLTTAILHGLGLSIGQRLLGWCTGVRHAVGGALGFAGLVLWALA